MSALRCGNCRPSDTAPTFPESTNIQPDSDVDADNSLVTPRGHADFLCTGRVQPLMAKRVVHAESTQTAARTTATADDAGTPSSGLSRVRSSSVRRQGIWSTLSYTSRVGNNRTATTFYSQPIDSLQPFRATSVPDTADPPPGGSGTLTEEADSFKYPLHSFR